MHEINLPNFETSELKYQNWNVITYEDRNIGCISSKSLACKIVDL